jgi:hypothetical protein
MKRRIVAQLRLSNEWLRVSEEPSRKLAGYLYSLYKFVGLNDPYAQMTWIVVRESETQIPYLIVYEEFEGEEEEFETQPSATDQESDSDFSEFGLSEEDLNPDLL